MTAFDSQSMDYSTQDSCGLPPTIYPSVPCAWSKTKQMPRKIRNPKLKLKIAPLRQLSLSHQVDDPGSPVTPLGPLPESPGSQPFYAPHNRRTNRVSALIYHPCASPPKSAPPTVNPAGGAFPIWHEKQQIEKEKASRVFPNVYLGSETDAANLDYLQASNITHVLNVSTHIPCFHENLHSKLKDADAISLDVLRNSDINRDRDALSLKQEPSSLGLKYKRLAASDNASQNLAQYFVEAFRFIDEALERDTGVLIHCQAGISRSSTILIAYIMFHSTLSMFEAYRYVKEKRAIISPNLNFMGQLLEFEQKLTKGEVPRSVSPEALGNDFVDYVTREKGDENDVRFDSL